MWIYIGDKSYKGLKTYRCSNCSCMVHVELELPDECPNCGERNMEMKNMEPYQMIKKLVEERDLALATVESQQAEIERLKKDAHKSTAQINREANELMLGAIKDILTENGIVHTYEVNEKAVIKAFEALEKQIPKKPIYSDYNDNGFDEIIPYRAECPSCGESVEFGKWNAGESHHCECGQAIEWSE